MGTTATTLAGLHAPVRDIRRPPVRDIVTTVESIDGTETQKDTTTERTLILDSKVLFPEDRATLSKAARSRLQSVASRIEDSSATGTVKVDGYADDQGSAQHGLVLSRQRAKAVRGVLAPLLAGSQFRIVTRDSARRTRDSLMPPRPTARSRPTRPRTAASRSPSPPAAEAGPANPIAGGRLERVRGKVAG